jgi:GDP-4-dehydro-6-deoxy-D-mannose reductase
MTAAQVRRHPEAVKVFAVRRSGYIADKRITYRPPRVYPLIRCVSAAPFTNYYTLPLRQPLPFRRFPSIIARLKGDASVRVLITGIAGFVGRHLAHFLAETTDSQVWGVARATETASLPASVRLLHGDLSDLNTVAEMLCRVEPDVVFHLAAQAAVPVSWRDPWGTLETNIRLQVNLLQALADGRWPTRTLVVGSEAEYGAVRPEDNPIDEDTPLRPVSPYAVSKVAQDMLGLQYFLSHNVQTVRVRPFPHIGPGQRTGFSSADFAFQLAEIEAGRREPVVRVGNLDVLRDFSDVRDVVRAYWLIIQHGTPGEVYNIGSGEARSVRSVLDGLVALSRVPIRVEIDPARFRPADVPLSVCDASRLRAATDWTPTIPFEKTLNDILDHWRSHASTRRED